MKHLATIPFADGLKINYLVPPNAPSQEGMIFNLEASRVGMGICIEADTCVAVVLAERFLEFDRRSERERRQGGGEAPYYGRYFLVIDEAVTALPQELIDQMIRLKDQYRISNIYGPDRPVQLVDSLRQAEGLTFYRREQVSTELSTRIWPSFVDYELRAGYAPRPVPDEQTVHRDLELGLSGHAKDPRNGGMLKGKDGEAVPLLNLPPEFNNLKTRSAIRQGSLAGCTALWHVFNGMNRSMVIPRNPLGEHEHVGNRVTGY